MSTKIVKLSAEELATCKLKDITNAVKSKFTEEEMGELKGITDEKLRREFLVNLYNKYIDEVIVEAKNESGDPATDSTSNPDASVTLEQGATGASGSTNPSDNKPVETKKEAVNTDVFFTASIKGVTGYSGTVSCSCDHLLKLAFLNPKTIIIEFRTRERANQFINIVKNVKTVKGLPTISEATRVAVINRVKEINGIK